MCVVRLRVWDSRTWHVTNTFPAKQYIQTHCDISSNCYHLLSSSNGFGGQGCEATVSVCADTARAQLYMFLSLSVFVFMLVCSCGTSDSPAVRWPNTEDTCRPQRAACLCLPVPGVLPSWRPHRMTAQSKYGIRTLQVTHTHMHCSVF